MLAKKLESAAKAVEPVYIEDVFSTWLYTGNGSTQTITNGIDLAGKGGLVWNKSRSNAYIHCLTDTARGVGNSLDSSDTAGNDYSITRISAFNADGFTMGGNSRTNASGATYASWTFRKQPKFFDVVTYTGTGSTPRSIPHDLGSVPGCVIIKLTSGAQGWITRHRSVGDTPNDMTNYVANDRLFLNTTGVAGGSSNIKADATTFTVNHTGDLNANGSTYVAYLFAHNAGGFGLSGTDNVISCGSYTGNGSATGPTITLGYEPQWLMIKNASGTGNWQIIDNMRGMPVGSADATLQANLTNAESSVDYVSPTATGFQVTSTSTEVNTNASTYIYIAIRRGPMKVPTSGTSVFSPIASSAASGTVLTTNFPVDTQFGKYRSGSASWSVVDRLRGVSTTSTEMGVSLATNSTAAEGTVSGGDSNNWGNTGFSMPSNLGGISDIFYNLRRAPGFFDEVCYTGTGSATTVTHNLGAVPELIIAKSRSGAFAWTVYSSTLGNSYPLFLNYTSDGTTNYGASMWGSTAPTATQFPVGTYTGTNSNGQTYVAYLFASCPGVSKVGSYTGNGSSQTINMGFTGGARFFLVKRTDNTGDWWVYDSARGIVAAADPALRLNSTAAEVTSADAVDTASSGLIVNQESTCNINVNGATYIYLGIA